MFGFTRLNWKLLLSCIDVWGSFCSQTQRSPALLDLISLTTFSIPYIFNFALIVIANGENYDPTSSYILYINVLLPPSFIHFTWSVFELICCSTCQPCHCFLFRRVPSLITKICQSIHKLSVYKYYRVGTHFFAFLHIPIDWHLEQESSNKCLKYPTFIFGVHLVIFDFVFSICLKGVWVQKNTKHAKQIVLDRRFTRKIKPRKARDGIFFFFSCLESY